MKLKYFLKKIFKTNHKNKIDINYYDNHNNIIINNMFDDLDDVYEDNFKVHISIQQRTARKYITLVSGIPEKYDLPKILKYIKKIYKCGGSIVKDKDKDDICILQITGDQRTNIEKFFVDYNVMDKNNIITHGF